MQLAARNVRVVWKRVAGTMAVNSLTQFKYIKLKTIARNRLRGLAKRIPALSRFKSEWRMVRSPCHSTVKLLPPTLRVVHFKTVRIPRGAMWSQFVLKKAATSRRRPYDRNNFGAGLACKLFEIVLLVPVICRIWEAENMATFVHDRFAVSADLQSVAACPTYLFRWQRCFSP